MSHFIPKWLFPSKCHSCHGGPETNFSQWKTIFELAVKPKSFLSLQFKLYFLTLQIFCLKKEHTLTSGSISTKLKNAHLSFCCFIFWVSSGQPLHDGNTALNVRGQDEAGQRLLYAHKAIPHTNTQVFTSQHPVFTQHWPKVSLTRMTKLIMCVFSGCV